MLNNEKDNDNLTTLDRLKIANSLLGEFKDKRVSLDDVVFYSLAGKKNILLPENIKEEYAKVTENYINGIMHVIKEVSELPVVDWMYKLILYIFCFEKPIKDISRFLKAYWIVFWIL